MKPPTTKFDLFIDEYTEPKGPLRWEEPGEHLHLADGISIWLYTNGAEHVDQTGQYLRKLKAAVDSTLAAFEESHGG